MVFCVIFTKQESKPGLPHCRHILYCLSHQKTQQRQSSWHWISPGDHIFPEWVWFLLDHQGIRWQWCVWEWDQESFMSRWRTFSEQLAPPVLCISISSDSWLQGGSSGPANGRSRCWVQFSNSWARYERAIWGIPLRDEPARQQWGRSIQWASLVPLKLPN